MCDISPIEWEALIPKENIALVFSTLEFNKDCGSIQVVPPTKA